MCGAGLGKKALNCKTQICEFWQRVSRYPNKTKGLSGPAPRLCSPTPPKCPPKGNPKNQPSLARCSKPLVPVCFFYSFLATRPGGRAPDTSRPTSLVGPMGLPRPPQGSRTPPPPGGASRPILGAAGAQTSIFIRRLGAVPGGGACQGARLRDPSRRTLEASVTE